MEIQMLEGQGQQNVPNSRQTTRARQIMGPSEVDQAESNRLSTGNKEPLMLSPFFQDQEKNDTESILLACSSFQFACVGTQRNIFFLGGGCVFKQPTIKCMILGAQCRDVLENLSLGILWTWILSCVALDKLLPCGASVFSEEWAVLIVWL